MKIKKKFLLKDGTEVVFRDPLIKDARQLLDHLYICATETTFLLSYAPDIKKRSVKNEEEWVRSFQKSDSLLIVAEVKDKIIGLAEMSFNRSRHKTGHRGTIGISVQKKYWNKGIGSIMFDEMIDYAERMGLEQLELGVIDQNERARRLYEKKGFEYTGKYPRAIRNDDGTYSDELLMVKFLSAVNGDGSI